MKRRQFIHTAAWSCAAGAPRLFADSAPEEPITVILRLAGGCDGLNTVVPIDNDHYYAARPNLAVPPAAALKISSTTGLHPGLGGLRELYTKGQLAIVEGVGYPDPCRSHFRAAGIWQAGLDSCRLGTCPTAQSDIDTVRKQIKPVRSFPDTPLAQELQTIAQLIRSGRPARIYHRVHSGFDTHINQAETHAARLQELGDALLAFYQELESTGQNRSVAVMVYSEFGRTLHENTSGGTDHGDAAPVFIIGGNVKGGLYGRRPSLAPGQLNRGAPAHTTDYRAVYAALLQNHMGIDTMPNRPKSPRSLNFI